MDPDILQFAFDFKATMHAHKKEFAPSIFFPGAARETMAGVTISVVGESMPKTRGYSSHAERTRRPLDWFGIPRVLHGHGCLIDR